jgi:HAD superfamily hydrolase (TIGR01509 family)
MPRIRWVFLDMGGVLVDDDALHDAMIKALHDVLAANGREMGLETVRKEFVEYFLSVPGAMTRGFLVEHIGDEERAANAITEFRKMIYPMFPKLYVLRPEAHATLDKLRERYKLGIVANQPAHTRDFVQASGLEPKFEFIILSGEVDFAKPDPRIFQLALSKAGCEPGMCVMVGDRYDADIAPSKRLGMRAVRIVSGMFSEQAPKGPEETPDEEIDSLAKLPDALRRLEAK